MKVEIEVDAEQQFGKDREAYLRYLCREITLEDLCQSTNRQRSNVQQMIGWVIDDCLYSGRVRISTKPQTSLQPIQSISQESARQAQLSELLLSFTISAAIASWTGFLIFILARMIIG